MQRQRAMLSSGKVMGVVSVLSRQWEGIVARKWREAYA